MRIDGGCYCGMITYEAEVDPGRVTICHCTDCQSLTGTAFRVTVFAAADDFRMSGTPSVFVKTAESGARREQAFCGTCGSHLYATSAGAGPKSYGIRVGTARQRRELTPSKQVWHHSALPWIDAIGSLEAVPKGG